MSEDVFTMADAEDDGLVKKEAGNQMAAIAKRESPELFEHFLRVCEEKGREPSSILGGTVLRALEDMDFAKSLSRKEIDMSVLRGDELRKEDVQYVNELADELGLNDESEDPINKAIEERIRGVSSSPLEGFTSGNGGGNQVDERMLEHLDRLNKRMDSIESSMGGNGAVEDSDNQSVDDLMDSVDSGNEDEGETTEEEAQIRVDISEQTDEGIVSSKKGVDE